jgi:hypothetical protein|tara:strand:+ start:236 stop:577 length:342 start_codon:yes stop_codon:yes gene_type:complete
MKLTSDKLRQMIKEELRNLEEEYGAGNEMYKLGYKDGFAFGQSGERPLQMKQGATKDEDYKKGFADGEARGLSTGGPSEFTKNDPERYKTDYSKPISPDNPMNLSQENKRRKS